MSKVNLQNIKKVHFIGIGGIGMSAIARMFLLESKVVSGSDRASSIVTEELEKLGAQIFYEQKAENISADIDLIIYTIAIPADNPELKKARELGITCLTYPETLGLISADKYTIAVAGTHGKTTTTAMIADILVEAKFDPTVIVGSLLKQGTNFIAGKSDYFVVEACEYCRSFLNLNPKILVITNIDSDHLDYYKDLADIQSAFVELAEKIPTDGFLVCDVSDPLLQPVIEKTKGQVIDYKKMPRIEDLLVPGEHNIKDAECALAVAEILKIDQAGAIGSLKKFTGTWRRFEAKGQTENNALVYDDYAHHPTEISASLFGAREFMAKNNLTGRLILVFQPHLYSRTKLLKTDFIKSLSLADVIILAPIYAARELPDPEISSEQLAQELKKLDKEALFFSDFDQIIKYLKTANKKGDLIVTMGAGDVYKIAEQLVEPSGKVC